MHSELCDVMSIFPFIISTRTYKLPCSGVGILPSLELSENTINFAATPINDTSTATISVRNPRLSRLNSAVIRGAVLPQGPKMFEFVVPEGSPITMCPKVATVGLGQVHVHRTYLSMTFCIA